MSWFNRVIIRQWCYYLTVLSLHSDAGLYNATKTLAFASYFCKMWVQILYWSPDGKLIFSEHFHSITDRIFRFKIWLWFSSPLNRTIDSDIKRFKSRTFNACKWPRQAKIKNLHTKCFAKNKLVELTYHKARLLMQYPRKYQDEKVMKFRVLKVESANSTMSESQTQSFRGAFMIPVTT